MGDHKEIAQAVQLISVASIILVTSITCLIFTELGKDAQERKEEQHSSLPYYFCGTASSFTTEAERGKTLFKNNCATCHNKNMKDKMTGPALDGVSERWKDYPRSDLFRWIRHSQKMIKEGHPRAAQLWKEWKPTVMNDFRELTDGEISAILEYIKAAN